MSIATVVGIAIGSFFGGSVIGAFLALIVASASRRFENQDYTEKNDSFDEQDRNEY